MNPLRAAELASAVHRIAAAGNGVGFSQLFAAGFSAAEILANHALAHALPANVTVRRAGEPDITTDLAAFAADNADDPELLAGILDALTRGNVVSGGGGAAGSFEVLAAACPEIVERMARAVEEMHAAGATITGETLAVHGDFTADEVARHGVAACDLARSRAVRQVAA